VVHPPEVPREPRWSGRASSRLGPAARRHFEYLRNLLANLKEDVTPEEYRMLLLDYLSKFLEIARPLRAAD